MVAVLDFFQWHYYLESNPIVLNELINVNKVSQNDKKGVG